MLSTPISMTQEQAAKALQISPPIHNAFHTKLLVLEAGLEPTRDYSHYVLSVARLPITLFQLNGVEKLMQEFASPEAFLEFLEAPALNSVRKVIASSLPPQEFDSPEEFLAILRPKPKPNIECAAPVVEIAKDCLTEYNLFDKEDLQKVQINLIRRLLNSGPHSLLNINGYKFEGDGIYTLYYCGSLDSYLPIRSLGAKIPIYIGKAAQTSNQSGIHSRLVEHYRSIKQTDLGTENFIFRFIILDPQLAEFSEKMLIETYSPVWNVALKGFGRGRRLGMGEEQKISIFDTKHPGRQFRGDSISQTTRSLTEVDQELEAGIWASIRAYNRVIKLLKPHDSTLVRGEGVEPTTSCL